MALSYQQKRKTVDFVLKKCGVRHLYGRKAWQFMGRVQGEVDLQHFKDTHPCRHFLEREDLYRYVDEYIIKQEPIDYLEFGVYQGKSMRFWSSLNLNKDSRFYGFDSFEGLPEDWNNVPKGKFDVGGSIPQIEDQRVQFIKGWFKDTLPGFTHDLQVKNRLIVHLDADLYSSAMYVLAHVTPFMSKGTVIIFDDFNSVNHDFKSLLDWSQIYKMDYQIFADAANYMRVCAELI